MMSGEDPNTSLSPSSTWRPNISTTTTARDGPSATQSTASGGDSTHAISFEKPQGSVYSAQSQSYIGIRFKLTSGVKVTSLTWYVDRDSALQKVNGCTVPDYTIDLELQSQEEQVVACKVADIIEPLRSDLGYPFIFSVDWTTDDQTTGRTSSPAFSIVRADSDIPEAQKKLDKSTYASSKPMPVENDGGSSSSSSKLLASTATSSAPTDLFTAPALPTSGSDRNGTSSNISPVGASHGGHKGGLGTGAIVGIAVGVVVAALLAAALCLFFFLRRRRRSKAAVAARDDQTRAEQEKLSGFPKDGGSGGVGGGAADASDAAIAPYRDEHNLAGGGGSGNARGGLDEHEEHAVPLRQQQQHGALDEEHGSGAADETPHGGVSRHLVEDGMTAAEIRRLEEEEAHLDSEIQRAGGRR